VLQEVELTDWDLNVAPWVCERAMKLHALMQEQGYVLARFHYLLNRRRTCCLTNSMV
jgi:hypothetical protein